MAERWRVYREGRELGLLTAQEIRDRLRDGSIDPFDAVSRENSKIRVDLVEVDEIFAIGAQEHQAATQRISQALKAQELEFSEKSDDGTGIPLLRSPQPMRAEPTETEAKFTAEPAKPISPVRMPKAVTARVRKPSPESKVDVAKNLDKRFQLFDKNLGVLGPLSAAEVQSLYFRGIVGRQVKVQKLDSERLVPIENFVAAYAGEKLEAFHQDGHWKKAPAVGGAAGLPSASVTQALNRSLAVRSAISPYFSPKTLMIFGITLGLLFAIFRAFDPKPTELQPARRQIAPRSQSKRPKLTRRELSESNSRTAPTMPAPAPAPAAPAPAPARAPKKSVPLPPRPATRSEERLNRVQNNSRARLNPLPKAPRQSLAAKQEPNAILAPLLNKQISLRGMNFDKAALARCPLKCQLTFTNQGGVSVVAIFFKGAYLDQLMAIPGAATISGTLKKDGQNYVLFVSGVR